MTSDDSEEEDDLHQCGRCKQLFRRMNDYFKHKKGPSCEKFKIGQKSNSEQVATRSENAEFSSNGKETTRDGLVSDHQNASSASAIPTNSLNTTVDNATDFTRNGSAFLGVAVSVVTDPVLTVPIVPVPYTVATPPVIDFRLVLDIDDCCATAHCQTGSSQVDDLVRVVGLSDTQDNSVVRTLCRNAVSTLNLTLENNHDISPLDPTTNVDKSSDISSSLNDNDSTVLCSNSNMPNNCNSVYTLNSVAECSSDIIQNDESAEENNTNDDDNSTSVEEESPLKLTLAISGEERVESTSAEIDSRHRTRYNRIAKVKKPVIKPRVFQCPQCAYVARVKDDYDRHLRRSHNLSVYVCPYCPHAFCDQYKLTRHVQKKHTRPQLNKSTAAPGFFQLAKKTVLCDILASRNDATSSPACFRCHICNESCTTYDDITQHITKHSPSNPGICRFCGAWFTNRYKLRRHISSSVHDDVSDAEIESFKIVVENMKITSYQTEMQTSSNTTAVLISCSLCDEIFSSQFELTKHKRLKHRLGSPSLRLIRAKLLMCKLCPASFYRRKEYKDHLVASHSLSEYNSALIARQCPVCAREFKHYSNVLRHRAAMHVPVQQVPATLSLELIPDTDITEKERTEAERDSTEKVIKSFSCFVCYQLFDDMTAYKQHIEFHRVWVAEHDLGQLRRELSGLLSQPGLDGSNLDAKLVQANNLSSSDFDTGVATSSDIHFVRPISPGTAPGVTVACDEGIILQPSENAKTWHKLSQRTLSLPCPYCTETFCDIHTLYDHKVKLHGLVAIFRCVLPSCKQLFLSASGYISHANIHAQNSFICKTCNEHCDTLESVMSHRVSAHRQCSLLASSSDNGRSANINLLPGSVKPAGRALRARKCGNISASPETKSKSILCDQCGETFLSKIDLFHHRVTHAVKSKHKCKLCGRPFGKKEHLQRHLVSRHSASKPHVCLVAGCGKAFKRKDKLMEHSKCHTGIKRHSCSICGRMYRYREGLLYHEKTHEKQQQFRCTQCSIPFVRASELRHHMCAAHGFDTRKEALRSYRCHICGQEFPRPERVKRHVERDHSVVVAWSYRCEVCNKGFPGSKSYKTHMERNHTGLEAERHSAGARLTRQRKCKLSQIHPVASMVVPLSTGVAAGTNDGEALSWIDGHTVRPPPSVPAAQSPDRDESSESSEDQVSDAENVPLYENGYYSMPVTASKAHNDHYSSREVHTSDYQYINPPSCLSAATPLSHHPRPMTSYDDQRHTSAPSFFTGSSYPPMNVNNQNNTDQSHYPAMSALEMEIVDSERISSTAVFSTSHTTSTVPMTSYSYSAYPSSAQLHQTHSSSMYPALGFYHSGYVSNRGNPSTMFSVDNNTHDVTAAAAVATSSSFSFTRANTFAPAEDRTSKTGDTNVQNLPAMQMFTTTTMADHATAAPFRPVAMPTTQQNPPSNPYAAGHSYASQAAHIGRWFGNMSLLNPLDSKQSMLDAVHFSRLPPERSSSGMSRTFGMTRRDSYITPSYGATTTERRMFDAATAASHTCAVEQRSSLIDYNFTSAGASDNHSRTMPAAVARREDHFASTHRGATALHQIPSHVPGPMAAMHMPLPLLPPPPPPPSSHQQQQFPPVGEYQWPAMPSMYNNYWL